MREVLNNLEYLRQKDESIYSHISWKKKELLILGSTLVFKPGCFIQKLLGIATKAMGGDIP